MEEKVFFKDSEGNQLCAIWSHARDDERSKIVILCHGLDSSKDGSTNTGLKGVFEKKSVSTFRFDFFGHGESEGKREGRTVSKFAGGIGKAIEYVNQLGYQKIGVCGTSFGGVGATIAVSKTQDVCVMALKAPGMGPTSRTESNYKDDFEKRTWIKAGEKITIPTLILHGSKDEVVELELGKTLANAIKSSKFVVFDGADHRFSKKEDYDQSIVLMCDFIVGNL